MDDTDTPDREVVDYDTSSNRRINAMEKRINRLSDIVDTNQHHINEIGGYIADGFDKFNSRLNGIEIELNTNTKTISSLKSTLDKNIDRTVENTIELKTLNVNLSNLHINLNKIDKNAKRFYGKTERIIKENKQIISNFNNRLWSLALIIIAVLLTVYVNNL